MYEPRRRRCAESSYPRNDVDILFHDRSGIDSWFGVLSAHLDVGSAPAWIGDWQQFFARMHDGDVTIVDHLREVGCDVGLTEYSITFGKGNIKAGKVKFTAENVGTSTHEFVVVRGDDPAKLPTKADGSVDEDKIRPSDQVGEMEDIASKATKSNTFDLTPGQYVVFCNVVTEDTPPISHFAKGMHTKLTVSP